MFDDFTPLEDGMLEAFLFSPKCLSFEIGDGVGLATLVFDGTNAIVQMIVLDWNYRDYLVRQLIEIAFERGASRATSFVSEDRQPAKELSKRMGCRHEATLRSAFLRGDRAIDVEIYGVLKEEYPWQQQQL